MPHFAAMNCLVTMFCSGARQFFFPVSEFPFKLLNTKFAITVEPKMIIALISGQRLSVTKRNKATL